MDTNTVQVITAFGTKLDEYIGVLSEKLGMAADTFWPLFVQQQQIEAITSIGMFVFFIVFALLFWSIGTKLVRNNKEDGYWCWAVSVITSIMLTLAVLLKAPCVAGQLFNPEYSALQALLNMIK